MAFIDQLVYPTLSCSLLSDLSCNCRDCEQHPPALSSVTSSSSTRLPFSLLLSRLLIPHIRRGNYFNRCMYIINHNFEFPCLPVRLSVPEIASASDIPLEELVRCFVNGFPEVGQIVAPVLERGQPQPLVELNEALCADAHRPGLDDGPHIVTTCFLDLTRE
ncbi:hypothetical protein EI94DRAFT_1737821 [Lactarius quietus]|nr:hypothetical protein EI94DRAFT_1737821 [Lactarius quietus]